MNKNRCGPKRVMNFQYLWTVVGRRIRLKESAIGYVELNMIASFKPVSHRLEGSAGF